MFHFRLFKENMMTKSFKKYKKKNTHTPYLDHFGSIFLIYGQNRIFIKILFFFFNSKYLFFLIPSKFQATLVPDRCTGRHTWISYYNEGSKKIQKENLPLPNKQIWETKDVKPPIQPLPINPGLRMIAGWKGFNITKWF